MGDLTVLVLAYMISPRRGSEYSVAWNYVTEMSTRHRLVVLYGTSGDHMGDPSELSDYLCDRPLPGVDFVYVPADRVARALNWPNERGYFKYSFYLAYRRWHQLALKRAKVLVRERHFDVIHYLGPIGYREPGFLWNIDLPYVWGPIGGAPSVPYSLFPALPLRVRPLIVAKNILNQIQLRTSTRLKRALARTDVLLTATSENARIFSQVHKVDSIYLPENGVVGDVHDAIGRFSNPTTIRIVWIGSMDACKALAILVAAAVGMRVQRRVQFHVIGDGPMRRSAEAEVRRLGLSGMFVWHGRLPREDVYRLLSSAHLNVVTSMREGNPTTIWEAMSFGVPTLTLDHCGMHDTVTEHNGALVPVTSYIDAVNGVRAQIERLVNSPEVLMELSKGALASARAYSWHSRRIAIENAYHDAIRLWASRRDCRCEQRL